jgi:hypothetical protein
MGDLEDTKDRNPRQRVRRVDELEAEHLISRWERHVEVEGLDPTRNGQ